MAISPNTDFTSGQILTATQMNQFPRGIVALTSSSTPTANFTSEIVTITGASFTAVANRYYKVSYFEPVPSSVTATGNLVVRIRQTNISGAIKEEAYTNMPQ
jgi:hypothetical protein